VRLLFRTEGDAVFFVLRDEGIRCTAQACGCCALNAGSTGGMFVLYLSKCSRAKPNL
jgi:hypothetical protein